MSLVFTYGTLMRGNSNHDYMDGSKFVSEATLEGYGIYDLVWYPGIKREEGRSVKGEIYQVPESRMAAIRRLEGEGRLYKETEVCCQTQDGYISCVAYVYLPGVTEKQRIDGNTPWRVLKN